MEKMGEKGMRGGEPKKNKTKNKKYEKKNKMRFTEWKGKCATIRNDDLLFFFYFVGKGNERVEVLVCLLVINVCDRFRSPRW